MDHHSVVVGYSKAGSLARGFVGRAAERTLVRHLLRDAAEGRPAVVVVSGVPGGGKTAMLDWAAGAATRSGTELLTGSGYETSVPFAALARLAAPFPDLAAAFRASGSGAPESVRPEPSRDHSATGEVARRLADALLARARRRPLAVLLDDVQDLGDASRSVLDDVLTSIDDAGARAPVPLLVILSVRLPIDPDSVADRALRLRSARSITLEGFDEREVSEYVASAGGRPTPSVVRELLTDTGGLPLLVESQVQRWAADGSRTDGRLHGHVTDDARVRTIADAIRLRFDQIEPGTTQTLQWAAVLGEPWSLEELAVVTEHDQAVIAAMTDTAEKARLVTRRGNVGRFAHPLVRSDLLDRFPDARRASLHRSIAERLEAHYAERGTITDEARIRIADHLVRGGQEPAGHDVVETTLRAGRIAMRWTAYGQAARFLSFSADAAVGLLPAGELARRYVEAGRAAYFDFDNAHAEVLFARAIDFARDAGEDAEQVVAAMLLARMRGAHRVRPSEDIDVSELRAALRAEPAVDVALRVQAEAALAEGLLGSGHEDAAAPVLRSAREAATAAVADPSIEDALGRLDFAAGLQPMAALDLDLADVLFADALKHGTAAGNPHTELLARSRRALLGLMRGSLRASQAELVEVEESTATAGLWGEAGLAAALLAFAEVAAGRPEAADRIEQAHRHWRRTGNPWTGAILSAIVPALDARTAGPGRLGREPSPLGEHRGGLPASSAFAALAAVEAHDVAAARQVVGSAGWRHGFRGPPTLNNHPVPTALMEVGDLLDDSAMVQAGFPALEHLAERGVLLTLPWPALVPRLLAVGARHAGDLDDAARAATAALELADREGLAPERAKCLVEWSRVSGGSGDLVEAEAAMSSAVRAFDELSMPGWIARCDDLARRLNLPPVVGTSGLIRERTILTNDVVGSTDSNARLGDLLYLEQLRVHDRLLRARLKEFRGVEIKHTGDGLNAVFDDRADAMRCAIAAMRDFAAWNADEPELALRIRCGLAHGSLVPSGGDFHGLVQSEAARLCSLASSGEVLATARVVEDCPPDVTVRSLGPRSLRGLPEEVEVFLLDAN